MMLFESQSLLILLSMLIWVSASLKALSLLTSA